MNILQLVLKQMRQRALGTWLTLLSVMLGVALAVTVLLMQRESAKLFGQTDFGYEVLVGPPKGSPLQLTLNTVYHLDQSPGNIPYSVYEQLSDRRRTNKYAAWVKVAVPFMVGDSFRGRRIVGTSPAMFGFDDDGQPLEGYDEHGRRLPEFEDPSLPDRDRDPAKKVAAPVMEYRKGRKYTFAEGRAFKARRFEAVIGSDVARELGLKIRDRFKATHGLPTAGEEGHEHANEWRVVGILEPTQTANDRVLFVPVVSLFAIEEHSSGLIEQALIKAGFDPNRIPPEQLPLILRQLGFDPEDLPPSVMRKFGLSGAGTQPTAPTQPAAPEGERPRPSGEGGEELLQSVEPSIAQSAQSEPASSAATTPAGEEKAAADHTDKEHAGEAHADDHEHAEEHEKPAAPPAAQDTAPSRDSHGDGHHEDVPHEGEHNDEHPATAHTDGHGEDHHEGEHGHDDHDHHHAEAFHYDDEGNVIPDLPKEEWQLSAVLVKTRGPFQTDRLMYDFRVAREDATAVSPAAVMRDFFDTFLSGTTWLLVVLAGLVSVVAAVSILVSIYNSVAARQREIAILRALGATRARILTLICLEAAVIGLLGGLLGLVAGHLLARVGSTIFQRVIGEGLDWVTVGRQELIYLGLIVVIATLAGLVPALKAYRTPVATNLTAA